MNKRNFLIKESLKKKLKSKWFLGINIFILIMVIITINLNSIISLFGGGFEENYTVYVKDELNIYDEFNKNFTNNNLYFKDNYKLIKSTKSLEELKEEALNNNNIIIVDITKDDENYIKADLYSKKEISGLITSAIQSSLNTIKYEIAVNNSNVSKEELQKINSAVAINRNILVKEQTEIPQNEKVKQNNQRSIIGAIVVVVFILPFFFLIVTLVQMIGAEINEEKTNKSMEIIISNVKPKDHLISKIVSCTTFMMVQILLIVLSFLIANLIKNSLPTTTTGTANVLMEAVRDMITPDVIKPIIQIIPLLIIFFIVTFISYAIIAGVLASITTSIDDFQQLQTPLMLIISLGFYLSIMAVIFDKARFIIALSYLPLISFLLSPSLYMLNQISLVSLIISIIIQTIFCILTYKYGLRIYKEGILNYSGTNLWRKLFRSIKK